MPLPSPSHGTVSLSLHHSQQPDVRGGAEGGGAEGRRKKEVEGKREGEVEEGGRWEGGGGEEGRGRREAEGEEGDSISTASNQESTKGLGDGGG